MKLKRRWHQARFPQWDDHSSVVTRKRKVVWWLAIRRFIGGGK